MTDMQTHAVRTTAVIALLAALGAGCTAPSERPEDSKRAVEAPADASRADAQPVAAGPARVEEPIAPVAERAPTPTPGSAFAPLEVPVPGCTAKLTFVPVFADARFAPPWISTTEVTWDMYDAFVFAMDRAETEKDPPDAFARPSKPYILMDRGFGHAGYPVISVSFRGATEFCRWLSARTGRTFRLPTESEWELAARGGGATSLTPEQLDAQAWYQANSKSRGRATTKPVGKKAANEHGLHDMLGNAAEWTVGPDGQGVLRGGSFKDPAEKLAFDARLPDDPAFNATDPQIPKSVWWLADGAFAGFRVLAEP